MPRLLLLSALAASLTACNGGADGGAAPAPTDAGLPDSRPPDAGPPPDLRPGPLSPLVDPFVGTGGMGFSVGSSLPGATAPFGLVKVSPDTTGQSGAADITHCAGYSYYDHFVLGFSHTHVHGTGAADYGHVLFLPAARQAGEDDPLVPGSRTAFSHDDEEAVPGYYAVMLSDGVHVELTATPRAAVHRWTFPAEGERLLLLDAGHRLGGGHVAESELDVRPEERLVEGWLRNEGGWAGRSGPFTVSFSASFDQAFEVADAAPGGSPHARLLRLSTAGPVEARVGISFVDVAGARGNREAEVEGVAFDTARERTEAAWEAELSRVEVAGGTDEQAAILYTSIYHALQMPTLLSDADGRYRGLDQEVHEAGDVPYYSDFSLWDTYRTLHPLLTLLWPEWQRQFLVALSRMGEEGGLVPRWPLGVAYTGSMLGDPADVVVAGSVVKGLTDFDVERTYALLQRTADGPLPEGARHGGRGCHAPYLEHGYCPADVQDGSVSWTLELGWADFALGNLAAWLGREDDAARYRARSEGWRHHVHPETGFLVGRNTDGTWVEPSEPWLPDEDLYVEGNAWHYQWLVPWDVPGLAEALGGREAMLARLDECFDKTLEVVEEAEAGGLNPKALPNPYYWHGNEPDIHAPWLYSALDRPDRTADVVRWVAGHEYGLGPEGLPGNDDAGTLAAWYVFAAVGIFPLAGDPTWWLGSPLFERVVLHLPDRDLEVRAPGASETRRYPARAWLGDRRLEVPRFDNGQLLEARVLTLEMAEEPVEW